MDGKLASKPSTRRSTAQACKEPSLQYAAEKKKRFGAVWTCGEVNEAASADDDEMAFASYGSTVPAVILAWSDMSSSDYLLVQHFGQPEVVVLHAQPNSRFRWSCGWTTTAFAYAGSRGKLPVVNSHLSPRE